MAYFPVHAYPTCIRIHSRTQDPLGILATEHASRSPFLLLHEKFLQSDWLREMVFQLNLKYPRVKITKLLWAVV